MIYPSNYEQKIGFDEIRRMLKGHCQSTLGQEKVDEIAFSDDASVVNEQMEQVREMRRLMQAQEKPEMNYFFDVRESVARIRLENTHLEENELWDLRRSLETIGIIVTFLNRGERLEVRGERIDDAQEEYLYPALHRMAEDVQTFPAMIRRIDSILDKFGRIKDSATMVLAGIRHDMEQTAGSISRTLYTILHAAQRDGLVNQDAAPTLRDGRLMIPVAPGLKRKINGIVHDEGATGKTVFIEPAEVVEANNKVRELEAAERREIIRILTVFSDELRPHVQEVLRVSLVSPATFATTDVSHLSSPSWVRLSPLDRRPASARPSPPSRVPGLSLPRTDTSPAPPARVGAARQKIPSKCG